MRSPSPFALIAPCIRPSVAPVTREAYQTGKPLGPPPGPVQAGGPLQPGIIETRRYALRPGLYYVVIDNTSAAGMVAPPVTLLSPLGGSAAQVSYMAQVGE